MPFLRLLRYLCLVRLVSNTGFGLQGANALTFDQLQGLTYLQVKGSGIANTCPVLDGGSSNLKDLKAGTYKLSNFCMEPTSFTVKEEGGQLKGTRPEFVKTRLMTRLTYTLGEVSDYLPVQLFRIDCAAVCIIWCGLTAVPPQYGTCMWVTPI